MGSSSSHNSLSNSVHNSPASKSRQLRELHSPVYLKSSSHKSTINSNIIMKRRKIRLDPDKSQDIRILRKRGEKRLSDLHVSPSLKTWLTIKASRIKYTTLRRASSLYIDCSRKKLEKEFHCTPKTARLIMWSLCSHSSLTKLTMILDASQGSFFFLKPFNKVLKSLRSLSHVTISLSQVDRPNEKYRDASLELYRNLRLHKQLKSLTVHFVGPHGACHLVSALSSSVSHIYSLSSFAVSFDSMLVTKAKLISKLALCVNHSKKLKKLEVSFHAKLLAASSILELLDEIAYLKDLTDLTIRMADFWPIERMELLLGQLSNLTSLTLGFLVEESILEFPLCLDHLNRITNLSLELKLQEFPPKKDAVSKLLFILRELLPLKSLTLNIIGYHSVKKRFRELMKGLVLVKQLSALNITICSLRSIDDDGIYHISRALPQMPFLKTLTLKLNNAKDLTDKTMAGMVKNLTEVRSLRNLCLDFYSCGDVGDKTVSSLSANIRQLVSLKALRIDLSGCKVISKGALSQLTSSLKESTSLLYLDLAFTSSRNANRDMDEIKLQLQPMKLVEANIRFRE